MPPIKAFVLARRGVQALNMAGVRCLHVGIALHGASLRSGATGDALRSPELHAEPDESEKWRMAIITESEYGAVAALRRFRLIFRVCLDDLRAIHVGTERHLYGFNVRGKSIRESCTRLRMRAAMSVTISRQ
jgi:hypothetical protein